MGNHANMVHSQQQHAMNPGPQSKEGEYQNSIAVMFNSPAFMNATIAKRRDIVGTKLYNYIMELVGENYAPKVTGMIIDLDPAELNQSILTFSGL